jgi:hypothetical protein
MPARAVVEARALTDTLGEIIDTSTVRPLDVYAVITVRGTLTDYLPTSVNRYVAAPTTDATTASFVEQIGALQTSATATLEAIQRQDADALMTQGNFLRTKFSGSDLDL